MLNEILNRIIDIFNLIGKDSVELKEINKGERYFTQSIPCYILVLQLALNKTAQNVHSFEILKSLNFYQNAISVIRNQLELNAKLYAPLLSNNFNDRIVQLFIEGGNIKDKYQQHESFLEINKMINKPDYINTLYSKMCKMAHPTTCLTLENMYDNHNIYPVIIRDEKDIINQVNFDGKDSDKNIKIQDLMKTMNEILEITEQIFTKHLNQKNNKRR
jgi:hypothetical protein